MTGVNYHVTVMKLGWNLEGTIHIVHRVSYLQTADLFIWIESLGLDKDPNLVCG